MEKRIKISSGSFLPGCGVVVWDLKTDNLYHLLVRTDGKGNYIEIVEKRYYKEDIMATKVYKIYGAEGHRQRESFNESTCYNFSEGKDARIIEVLNSDKTGTNDYSVVKITRNTPEECEEELHGQLTDGIFENCRIGKIV